MKASKAAIRIMKNLSRLNKMVTFLIEDMGYTVLADGSVSKDQVSVSPPKISFNKESVEGTEAELDEDSK